MLTAQIRFRQFRFRLKASQKLPPQGFRPEGEISRRHSSNSRVYYGKSLQLKYTVSMPEKIQGPRRMVSNYNLDFMVICPDLQ